MAKSNIFVSLALKSILPQIEKKLADPKTKRQVLDYINEKKAAIELQNNEDDVVLIVETDDNTMNFLICTIEDKEIQRVLYNIKFEELTTIINSFIVKIKNDD